MRTCLIAWVAMVFSVVLLSDSARAQMPGAGPGNIAFLRIFDQHKSFSATADMRITDNTKDSMDVSFGLATSEGKVRFEVDLAKAKGSMISPEVVAQMKAVGMDRAISVMRMDKKRLYVIYPGLKAYADVVMPDESVQSLTKTLKIQKTPQGSETVSGHPCTKTLVTLTDDKGSKERITSWEATDMKAFPIQAQLFESGQNIVIKLRDVKQSKPDAQLFEPPVGYKKYNDMQSLMTQAVAGKQ